MRDDFVGSFGGDFRFIGVWGIGLMLTPGYDIIQR